jgi:phosphoglycolate phosphatase-like HAD superfamily hydrolase
MTRVNLLWDIDGTLLDTHGIGVKPLENAIRMEFPKASTLVRGKFSGFTDFEIIAALSGTDMNNPINHERYIRIISDYTNSLRVAFEGESATSIGEVSNVLSGLKDISWVRSYIGTGNYELTGWLKLQSAELDKFFSPESMFGGDVSRMQRSEIIKNAKTKLGNSGIPIIIGDSPADIHAAELNAIKVIGVPTGYHDFSTLNKLIPGWVLPPNWRLDDLLIKVEEVSSTAAL